MLNIVYLLIGIGLLTAGGEALIRGALGIAKRLQVSPLLSGLIVVGFGTSMPELVVSVDAAYIGQPDIAIGNVVGSNIGNILFILGLCAVITPLAVAPLALQRDAVTMIFASLLFVYLVSGGILETVDGAILLTMLLSYFFWAYWSESYKAAPSAVVHEAEAGEVELVPRTSAWSIAAVVIGLTLMIIGSRVLLKGAVGLAQGLGVSEAVIGLTLVAVGTSLPELSISVIAAFRRHADVAIGNVLGSNIFNLLGILGVSSIIGPLKVTGRVIDFDQWVMLGSAILLLLFLLSGRQLNRFEGSVLLFGYLAYVWASFTVVAN